MRGMTRAAAVVILAWCAVWGPRPARGHSGDKIDRSTDGQSFSTPVEALTNSILHGRQQTQMMIRQLESAREQKAKAASLAQMQQAQKAAYLASLDALVGRIKRAAEAGDAEATIQLCTQYLSLEPTVQAVRWIRGVAYAQKGSSISALNDFNAVLRAGPGNPDVLLAKAAVHIGMKNYSAARLDVDDAITYSPDNADAYLARAFVIQKEPERIRREMNLVISDIKKAVRLRPDDPNARNDLAWVLATSPNTKIRDGAAAVTQAKKACELTKNSVEHSPTVGESPTGQDKGAQR
jgi:tetratricopeptide (TPR) repeat protein